MSAHADHFGAGPVEPDAAAATDVGGEAEAAEADAAADLLVLNGPGERAHAADEEEPGGEGFGEEIGAAEHGDGGGGCEFEAEDKDGEQEKCGFGEEEGGAAERSEGEAGVVEGLAIGEKRGRDGEDEGQREGIERGVDALRKGRDVEQGIGGETGLTDEGCHFSGGLGRRDAGPEANK